MRSSAAADPYTYQNGNGPARRTTGRAARVHRPQNYYARPYGPTGMAADQGNDMPDHNSLQAQGFFPALQFFSDAITALPKEVMKQFTFMKEVEAKIHGPHEKLSEMIDSLMELPVPSRKPTLGTSASAGGVQGLLSFTANNSANGSAAASLVNGVPGRQSMQPEMSLSGDDALETDEDRTRRRQFSDLRMVTHSLLNNLDEKNVVLTEANRVLELQSWRLDSVMAHIDDEISEEARLGSMTHWAYSDNRQKKQVTGTGAAKQRDVAATNSLADAAHEIEIAQARVAAGREATKEKGKGKRTEHAGDSDFDDKPRKMPKVAKAKAAAAAAAAAGLGITNGEPATKRKKATQGLAAAGMERTVSSGGRGSKAVRDTPRSTPTVTEPPAKKAPKAKPAPTQTKKKVAGSAQNSPMLASSPLASTFNPLNMEPPPNARPQAQRMRQNSTATATNLRHERVMDEDSGASRPASASGAKTNGNGNGNGNGNAERVNGRRKIHVHETTEEHDEPTGHEQAAQQLEEASERLEREDVDMQDDPQRLPASRSGSDRGKNSGPVSKGGTPRMDGDEASIRDRRTRSKPNIKGEMARDSDSSTEPQQMDGRFHHKHHHRRNQSGSHLVKQLAPFNKSPNMDRHRDTDDDDDEVHSSTDGEEDVEQSREMENHHSNNVEQVPMDTEVGEREQALSMAPPNPSFIQLSERETRRSSTRRPLSRRNTLRSSPGQGDSRESSPPASPPPTSTRGRGRGGAGTSKTSSSTSAAARDRSTQRDRERERERERDNFLRDRRERDERERELEIERSAALASTRQASSAAPAREPGDYAQLDDEEIEGEESEHDPDDPNEPKYCYCNRGSYGEMVACDNELCPREWFHLGCTELRVAPGEEEKWFCRDCRPKGTPRIGTTGRGRGRGRGGRGRGGG